MTAPVRIALLGSGVVGTSVARRLVDASEELAARVGAPLEVVGVAVRDLSKDRSGTGLPADLFTDDPASLVGEADVVVELMGGIEPTKQLLTDAIASGASVVTANKALLGRYGPELYEAADAAGVDFSYEAAVAGAIPIIRPMRESLAGDRVNRVMGIMNGTTNFILDKMDRTGAALDDVLREAQELGYAEADPTADVEGHDAQAKAAILASLAFHTRVNSDDVHTEGIMGVTADDIAAARAMGCVVKLLGVAERLERDGAEAITVRVHPTLIDRSHPLASVHGAFNAVFVETELAGELMFYGQGAGGDPTASAVLGDVVRAAQNKVRGASGPGESAYAALPVEPVGSSVTRYSVRVDVRDEPGVLAKIAGVFGDHGVSIDSMRQGKDRTDDGLAVLHLVTDRAGEKDLRAVVDTLETTDAVLDVRSVLRYEGA